MGVHVELQQRQLQTCLMELKQNDQRAANAPLPHGALPLNDLSLLKLKRLQNWSEQGVYWHVRYKAGQRIFNLHGPSLDLPTLLQGTEALHLSVSLGTGKDRVRAELHPPLLKEQARID